MKDILFYFVLFLAIVFIVSPEQIRSDVVEHLKVIWNLLIYQKVIP